MESGPLSLNESPPPQSWWRATDAPPPIGIYSRRFSPKVTLLAAIFLVGALAMVVWLSDRHPSWSGSRHLSKRSV